MTSIKLTNPDFTTRGGTCWGEGVTHSAKDGPIELCTDTAIHFYEGLHVAAFMYPVHINTKSPVAWLCEPHGEIVREGPFKAGTKSLTTISRVDLPVLSNAVCIRVAIQCAKLIYDDPEWNEWADKWLSGEDRSMESAWAAWAAWAAAAEAAEWAWAVMGGKAGAIFNLEAMIIEAMEVEG